MEWHKCICCGSEYRDPQQDGNWGWCPSCGGPEGKGPKIDTKNSGNQK